MSFEHFSLFAEQFPAIFKVTNLKKDNFLDFLTFRKNPN